MRVLFTDFDGVLNCTESWQVTQDAYNAAKGESGETPLNLLRLHFDSERVRILNDILSSTGAVVVLSTSWRNWPDQDYVRGKLKDAGFTGNIIGSTPGWLGPRKTRGDEIQAWLDEHRGEVETFAILDDGDDMGALKPHLVLTDPEQGLTREHVGVVADLLCPNVPMNAEQIDRVCEAFTGLRATRATDWTQCRTCDGPVLIGTFCGECSRR